MADDDTPTPTYRGRLIGDGEIQHLADEAEDGFEPSRLRRTTSRAPTSSAAARVVLVRLDPELDEALQRRAEADQTTASDVIRTALRSWLTAA